MTEEHRLQRAAATARADMGKLLQAFAKAQADVLAALHFRLLEIEARVTRLERKLSR